MGAGSPGWPGGSPWDWGGSAGPRGACMHESAGAAAWDGSAGQRVYTRVESYPPTTKEPKRAFPRGFPKRSFKDIVSTPSVLLILKKLGSQMRCRNLLPFVFCKRCFLMFVRGRPGRMMGRHRTSCLVSLCVHVCQVAGVWGMGAAGLRRARFMVCGLTPP